MTQIEWDAKNVELNERKNKELKPLHELLDTTLSERHELRLQMMEIQKRIEQLGELHRKTCLDIKIIKERYNHEKSILLSERPE